MGDRITRTDAERMAREVAKVMGLPYGHYVIVDDEPEELIGISRLGMASDGRPRGRYKVQMADGRWMTTQPGAIELDYNPTYGGCVISRIADDGGTWVYSRPFSEMRRTPREFVDYCRAFIAGWYADQDANQTPEIDR